VPGMRFYGDRALGRDFSVADLEADHHAVFLAPGLWAGAEVKIPGAEQAETTDALGFLQSCRLTERPGIGKRVLVIGGGGVASDAALSARHFGAAEVTLVCLEGREEMPCGRSEIAQMERRGVRIENRWGPRGFVSGTRISFVRCVSAFSDAGRFKPVFEESATLEMDFDQVILAVGQRPEPGLAMCLKKEFGREEGLEVDATTMQVVGRIGVFAGGDIVRGAGTVVEAVADGRRAAMAIDHWLTP